MGLTVYNYLLVKRENVGNATINGITNPRQGLIGESDDSITAAVGGDAEEELGGVAGSKHPVYGGEVGGAAVIGVEVGRKHTPFDAFPPQVLACSTRPQSTTSLCFISFMMPTTHLSLSLSLSL